MFEATLIDGSNVNIEIWNFSNTINLVNDLSTDTTGQTKGFHFVKPGKLEYYSENSHCYSVQKNLSTLEQQALLVV